LSFHTASAGSSPCNQVERVRMLSRRCPAATSAQASSSMAVLLDGLDLVVGVAELDAAGGEILVIHSIGGDIERRRLDGCNDAPAADFVGRGPQRLRHSFCRSYWSVQDIEHPYPLTPFRCRQRTEMGQCISRVLQPGCPELVHRGPRELVVLGGQGVAIGSIDKMQDIDVRSVANRCEGLHVGVRL